MQTHEYVEPSLAWFSCLFFDMLGPDRRRRATAAGVHHRHQGQSSGGCLAEQCLRTPKLMCAFVSFHAMLRHMSAKHHHLSLYFENNQKRFTFFVFFNCNLDVNKIDTLHCPAQKNPQKSSQIPPSWGQTSPPPPKKCPHTHAPQNTPKVSPKCAR